jgi:hypothetical protein
MFDSILAILMHRTSAQWCFSTMVETNSDPGAWEHGPGFGPRRLGTRTRYQNESQTHGSMYLESKSAHAGLTMTF